MLTVAVLVAEDPPQPGAEEILRAHQRAGHDTRIVYLGQVILRAGAPPRLPGWPQWRPAVAHSRASAMWSLDVQARLEEDAGLRIVNSVSGQRAGRDKWVCARALAAAGVPAGPSMLAVPGTSARQAVSELGTDHVVVKPLTGYGGAGLIRCCGISEIASALRAAAAQGLPRIIQPYIEAGGESLREIVIGGTVAARVTMRARPGEWRSNLALGAAVHPAAAGQDADAIAVAAARATRLEIAAVDTINGLVTEVNTNAGSGPALSQG